MKVLIKKTSEHAVVGVVTAILLIGLIVSVISFVQTMYIPKIMEQREADHMDKVAEQFTYLTTIIDGQALNEIKNRPLTTSITLGSKELPYMLSVRSFGTLEILDNDARAIDIYNDSDDSPFHFPFGAITYSSGNAYFLDQSYIYEAGAMIVNQTDGNSMMIPPIIFAYYDATTDTVTISFDVVNISSVGNKNIASGYGTYPIQTEFHDILPLPDHTFTDVSSITIATPFSNAWLAFINHTLIEANLEYEGYDSQFFLTDMGDHLRLDIESRSDLPTVNIILKIIEIRAQIGPGWVD